MPCVSVRVSQHALLPARTRTRRAAPGTPRAGRVPRRPRDGVRGVERECVTVGSVTKFQANAPDPGSRYICWSCSRDSPPVRTCPLGPYPTRWFRERICVDTFSHRSSFFQGRSMLFHFHMKLCRNHLVGTPRSCARRKHGMLRNTDRHTRHAIHDVSSTPVATSRCRCRAR